MKVHQHVYFALRSEHMSAAVMTARLGIEPDEIKVRASRKTDPPRPVCHSWKVNAPEQDLGVDDMILTLIDHLEPHAEAIGALAKELDRNEPGRTAVLQVVRYFHDAEDGILPLPEPPVSHRPLGWHFDRRVLNFLQVTCAELSVDEYGDAH
ncbi:DUF4279 domain-containing protein [Streptosporangium canum]|uniref:DUF4279 domain-containing protein n=1 Tax=Streptosporangium canum TaxID=324952 RepID=UPI00368E0A6F